MVIDFKFGINSSNILEGFLEVLKDGFYHYISPQNFARREAHVNKNIFLFFSLFSMIFLFACLIKSSFVNILDIKVELSATIIYNQKENLLSIGYIAQNLQEDLKIVWQEIDMNSN